MSSHGRRAFERIVVIMFENEFRGYVRRNPYMRSLAAQGIELANYFGVMHPSNTNYVASIAGEICNITQDPIYYTFLPLPPGVPDNPGPDPLTQTTLADTLTAKGLDWGAYLETHSTVDFPPQLGPVTDSSGKVDVPATVRKTILDYPPFLNMHAPFVRFKTVMENESQWKRIATSYDFLRQALDGTLPEFSWFTPDIWSCGHWMWGTEQEPAQRAPFLVDQLAMWLRNFFGVLDFPGRRSRLPKGTLVMVTFDEADYNASYEDVYDNESGYDGPDQIYAVLLGDMIRPRRIEQEGYNHYSLLRTVEQNFGLSTLGKNDRDANWFRFLWGHEFRWRRAEETPIEGATMVAAAPAGSSLAVVYGSGGALQSRSWRRKWSDAQSVPAPADVTAIAMATAGDTTMLVCQSGGALYALALQDGAWSQPQQIVAGATAFSLVAFLDYGDGTEKLMLAWNGDGGLQSQVFANEAWGSPVAVGHETDGALVLATLGASLFLIHKATGTNEMDVVSYNTAPFNVVTSGGDSNTTQYAWSPSEYPVAHFAAGPRPLTGVRASQPILRPYQGIAPFAAATLDGVIHFAHASVDGNAVQTETFSLSGVLTPQNPVSYQENATGVSNGYGTLAEAGWSRQHPILGLETEGGAAMAMACLAGKLVLLSQPQSGGALQLSVGSYR